MIFQKRYIAADLYCGILVRSKIVCLSFALSFAHDGRLHTHTPGVGEYDKVAIISNNRWEWAAVATAAFSMNATIVPMYEAQLSSDWAYILNDSRSCAVMCATQAIYDRLHKQVLSSTPSVHAVLCLDAAKGEPHAFSTAMAAVGEGDLEGKLIMPPTPEDLADLIYTSGTTGRPKGKLPIGSR